MKNIAYIALCPLGDVICCINQLEELKRIYAPCTLTVFAIPLITQLLQNYKPVDKVVTLDGAGHGILDLSKFQPPEEEFDAVFNMAYHVSYIELQKKLKSKKFYGSECKQCGMTKEICAKYFDKWVTEDYWNNVTLKKYRTVCEQMAEPIRLVAPVFCYSYPVLSAQNYVLEKPADTIPENMVMIMPGSSQITKCWPLGKYLAIAKILSEVGKNVVFAVGPQEQDYRASIQQFGYQVFDSLPIPQLAYAICQADLVIGNDSGPMHLAAALQQPTVHIIAGGSAFNWYPYQEPLHSLVMPECGNIEECRMCGKTCIGTISTETVLSVICRKLGLTMPPMRHVAFFMQDRIGDCLTAISNIEEATKIYAPCDMTVFVTAGMMPFFQAYAFTDKCVLLQGDKTAIPDTHFEAVFNHRYDRQSTDVMRQLTYDKGYGYENCDIPENVCKELYTGGYLPLTLWDDIQLRRYTSVTEQAACLIRLVEPDFHCQYPSLAENTLVIDWKEVGTLKQPRKSVIFVLGGSYKSKCWPLEKYLLLAKECIVAKGFTPFFLLGPEEKEHIPRLKSSGYPYAYCASFSQIAGLAIQWLVNRALVIGNDTGVMHLLKILDCRTITISANDAHFTWEPYNSNRHFVLFPACSRVDACTSCRDYHCMAFVTYEIVRSTLERELDLVAKMY